MIPGSPLFSAYVVIDCHATTDCKEVWAVSNPQGGHMENIELRGFSASGEGAVEGFEVGKLEGMLSLMWKVPWTQLSLPC